MQTTAEDLRRHYRSLSDEALLEVDRVDLTEAARGCCEAELKKRGLTPLGGPEANPESGSEAPPDWFDESAQVYATPAVRGERAAAQLGDARDGLEGEGIPCYVRLCRFDDEPSSPVPLELDWRLYVPGDFSFLATNILDRDIFNQEFEADWRTHLTMLSDEEVSAMNPDSVFCGLIDRIERVKRVYSEEIARRGLE